jgi:pimeloyl-ACP methyl ester carboxylesterase
VVEPNCNFLKSCGRFAFIFLTWFSLSLAQAGESHTPHYANIEGRKVYYEESGRGKAILLIHGFSLDARMWDEQFDSLAGQYHVVRYDISGYGRSTVPESTISSSDEIAALLKSLGIDKATVVGMSLGGSAAVRFAIDYPQSVEAVITVSSTLEGFPYNEPLSGRLGSYPKMARDSGMAKAKEAWLKDLFMTPVTNAGPVNARIRQIIAEWSGSQFANPALWSFKKFPPPAIRRLIEIRVPALVIVGEKDDLNIHVIADTLSARIPGARKMIIPDSGHLLNLERPGAFNKIILDFLSENLTH